MAKSQFWCGSNPSSCEICKQKITNVFIDGNTSNGHWANMCESCHKYYGVGLGIGKGQKYEKQANGQFLKTAG